MLIIKQSFCLTKNLPYHRDDHMSIGLVSSIFNQPTEARFTQPTRNLPALVLVSDDDLTYRRRAPNGPSFLPSFLEISCLGTPLNARDGNESFAMAWWTDRDDKAHQSHVS